MGSVRRPALRRLSRRRLLAGASTVAGSLALGNIARAQIPTPSADVPEDPTKEQGLPLSPVGERSRFVILGRTFAANTTTLASWSFTPLQHLHGTITPSDLHFERHHGGVPIISPDDHTLLVHGLVDRPVEFTVADIKRFPAVTLQMFLECSGNSLAQYGETPPEATAQDIHGLTSTSEWIGVPVSTLMAEVGAQPDGAWVLAEGADAAVMTRSIPMEKMMDDAIIAWGQNGEDLRPEQGFPLRLFLPGWEGNMNIKWLRRLEVGAEPFMTREETSKYTDAMADGTIRQFTFPMDVKSVITWPSTGHVLSSLGTWEIRGIAWSGHGRIETVEVSVDGGETWNEAELQGTVLPICHTRFSFLWEWDGAETVIMSRATDETGVVQPTRQQLLDARGANYVYHYNGIQAWRVHPDGSVTNELA